MGGGGVQSEKQVKSKVRIYKTSRIWDIWRSLKDYGGVSSQILSSNIFFGTLKKARSYMTQTDFKKALGSYN